MARAAKATDPKAMLAGALRASFDLFAEEAEGRKPSLAAVKARLGAVKAWWGALGDQEAERVYRETGAAWAEEKGRCFRCGQRAAAPCCPNASDAAPSDGGG